MAGTSPSEQRGAGVVVMRYLKGSIVPERNQRLSAAPPRTALHIRYPRPAISIPEAGLLRLFAQGVR